MNISQDVEKEVSRCVENLFDCSIDDRSDVLRNIFVDLIGFSSERGIADYAVTVDNISVVFSSIRIAVLEDIHVVFIKTDILSKDNIDKSIVLSIYHTLTENIGDDILMIFINESIGRIQFIRPRFNGVQLALYRISIDKNYSRQIGIEQIMDIILQYQNGNNIHDVIDNVFDIESISRKFFTEYKRVFDFIVNNVEGFEKEENKRVFIQTLFNRIFFVYFFQLKNMLDFNGRKGFLESSFETYISKKCNITESNFYNDVLKLLFRGGLNNYLYKERFFSRTNQSQIRGALFRRIPLFEINPDDNNEYIIVPDECIYRVFDRIFHKFKFTVIESSIEDMEIAIDPEVLGKVFEEFVTGRHDSGSYYTPRSVVSFMCKSAIQGYLEDKLSNIDKKVISLFVNKRDISNMTLEDASEIEETLERITVIDPACGSGAYLIGMMQELVDLHIKLYGNFFRSKKISIYDIKLRVIMRNLYGVDIDQFAINIAMVRLWLSLLVDYKHSLSQMPPLDFHIVQGDSLLGSDPSSDTYGDMFRFYVHEESNRIGELKLQYMDVNVEKRKDIKKNIEEIETSLRNTIADAVDFDNGINWRIQFAEIFTRGGFDVVIANPPYVRHENIGSIKPRLRKLYNNYINGRSDLYCYFYIRSLQILRKGGIQIFICSNSWLDVLYGKELQKYLLKNAHIITIYDNLFERQFSSAQINTIISVIRNGVDGIEDETHFVSLHDNFEVALDDPNKRRDIKVRRGHLLASVGDKWGAKYFRSPDIYNYLMKMYKHKFIRLSEVATSKSGVSSGYNAFFFLDDPTIQRWGIEDEFLATMMSSPKESQSILLNSESYPYKLFLCDRDKGDIKETAALEYIEWGEKTGLPYGKIMLESRKRWYSITKNMKPNRVALGRLIYETAYAFMSMKAIYFSDAFMVVDIKDDLIYPLCKSLNSSLMQLIINVEGRSNFGGGILECTNHDFRNLYIVNPNEISCGNKVDFESNNWNMLSLSKERKELDNEIFDIVGLTLGERDEIYSTIIRMVENRKNKSRSV